MKVIIFRVICLGVKLYAICFVPNVNGLGGKSRDIGFDLDQTV